MKNISIFLIALLTLFACSTDPISQDEQLTKTEYQQTMLRNGWTSVCASGNQELFVDSTGTKWQLATYDQNGTAEYHGISGNDAYNFIKENCRTENRAGCTEFCHDGSGEYINKCSTKLGGFKFIRYVPQTDTSGGTYYIEIPMTSGDAIKWCDENGV